MKIVRQALPEEIDWINQQYADVGFKLSVYENEFIAISEIANQKVGLGRLQKIDNQNGELGGMYVLPDFQNKGIASSIVKFLLENAKNYSHIFCLPFEHLENFYNKFGFYPPRDSDLIPSPVKEKHAWCNQEYPHKTLLLVRN